MGIIEFVISDCAQASGTQENNSASRGPASSPPPRALRHTLFIGSPFLLSSTFSQFQESFAVSFRSRLSAASEKAASARECRENSGQNDSVYIEIPAQKRQYHASLGNDSGGHYSERFQKDAWA